MSFLPQAGRRAVRDRRRRPTAQALVLVCLLLAGACRTTQDAQPLDPVATELLERLERRPDEKSFSFRHRAGGTRVNDCFMANREFSGEVDAEAGTVVIRNGSAGEVVAISTPEAALLHESLFRADSVPAEWVRLPDDRRAAADALRRSLGPDLLPYAVNEDLPASGQATAIAFLRVSRKVTSDGDDAVGGTPTERFRIEVDRDRFESELAAAGEEPAAGGRADAPPTIFVWVSDDDRIVRVEVRPPADERLDEPPVGWATEYASLDRTAEMPQPTELVELTPADLSALAPPLRTTCELPL